jgi:LysM repeat protein
MEVAQWEVDAIANGSSGHTRPDGLTLGQWLISLGYPLSGDLSLDGYRSENFILGIELTVRDAIEMWLGDEPHTNTMLSPDRSDIGAAVAFKEDEWGQMVYYYVIETALQTSSGQQQYSAQAILTNIPLTQLAIYGDATQAAQALSVPQYIIPVSVNTARPDGDVIHEVKYGQTLWSVAITYGVKIEQIKRLNNLSSTDIYPGQKLLVQKGATQPVPSYTEHATLSPQNTNTLIPLTPTMTLTAISNLDVQETGSNSGPSSSTTGIVVGIVMLAVLLAGLFTWLFAQRTD